MKGPDDLAKSDLIAYLDDEVPMAEGLDTRQRTGGRDAPVPAPTAPKPVDPAAELGQAKATVRDLAAARRYRHAPLRWSGSARQRFVRLAGDGTYLRLNESGGVVMDALDGGSLADAARALRERYGIDQERAHQDAVRATRDLLQRRVVMTASASKPFPTEPGTSDLPGLERTE